MFNHLTEASATPRSRPTGVTATDWPNSRTMGALATEVCRLAVQASRPTGFQPLIRRYARSTGIAGNVPGLNIGQYARSSSTGTQHQPADARRVHRLGRPRDRHALAASPQLEEVGVVR